MRRLEGRVTVTGEVLRVERDSKPTVEIPIGDIVVSSFTASPTLPEAGALEVCTDEACFSIVVPNEDGPVFLAGVRQEATPDLDQDLF